MTTVVRRPLAALDLRGIRDPVADDDMAAADRWVDEPDTGYDRFAPQPTKGRARPALATDLWSLAFQPDVIVELLLPGGIDAVRVLHSVREVDGDLLAGGARE